jgi:hypothetical protein
LLSRYADKSTSKETILNKVLQFQKSTFSQLDRTYLPVLDQLLTEQEDEDKETWLHAFRGLVGRSIVEALIVDEETQECSR